MGYNQSKLAVHLQRSFGDCWVMPWWKKFQDRICGKVSRDNFAATHLILMD